MLVASGWLQMLGGCSQLFAGVLSTHKIDQAQIHLVQMHTIQTRVRSGMREVDHETGRERMREWNVYLCCRCRRDYSDCTRNFRRARPRHIRRRHLELPAYRLV